MTLVEDRPEAPARPPDRSAALRAAEPDFLRGLIDAGDRTEDLDESEIEAIWIPPVRGRPGYTFHVHGIDQTTYLSCTDRATPLVRNADLGATTPGKFNPERYWAEVILAATTEDDSRTLWHNAELLRAHRCRLAHELVLRLVPKTGWRQDIVSRIDRLSGLGERLPTPAEWEARQQARLEDALGN